MISTVAGDGSYGSSGDGGSAALGSLATPWGLSFDIAGSLYIADVNGGVIRKIDSHGDIATVAGIPSNSPRNGDGGTATQARLNQPFAVDVGANGHVYITELAGQRVRGVDLGGIISTTAGTGDSGYADDAGLAADAQVSRPQGLATSSSGALFIADTGNHSVRRVKFGRISTIAGDGSSGYRGDGGLAANAQMSAPGGLDVYSNGNVVVVADTANHRVRRISYGTAILSIAGTGVAGFGGDGGPAALAQLNLPTDVATDSAGNLYIADTANHRIRKVDSAGNVSTIAGTGIYGYSGDSGPALQAQLATPSGVAVDTCGNIYVADSDNDRVRVMSSDSQFRCSPDAVRTFGSGGGSGGGSTGQPWKNPSPPVICPD